MYLYSLASYIWVQQTWPWPRFKQTSLRCLYLSSIFYTRDGRKDLWLALHVTLARLTVANKIQNWSARLRVANRSSNKFSKEHRKPNQWRISLNFPLFRSLQLLRTQAAQACNIGKFYSCVSIEIILFQNLHALPYIFYRYRAWTACALRSNT